MVPIGRPIQAKFDPASGKQVYEALKTLDLPTNIDAALKEARISYDPVRGVHLFHTKYGVKIDAGEVHIPFFNDTGVTIENGKAVNVAGSSPVNQVLKGILADNSQAFTSSSVIGINSADVPDQSVGLATLIGRVSDYDTSGLSEGGITYLSTNGDSTNVRPKYPSNIVILGSCIKSDPTTGIFQAKVDSFRRVDVSRYDSFSSQGAAAGTFYTNGHLDWATTSFAASQASPSVSYGAVGRTQAAHVGIVPSGPGVVDTGQVGLRVTGIKDNEVFGAGGQTVGATAIITEDITTLTANTMAETVEKFSGNVTFELYIVSGAPTTYSLTFNYGFSKYTDFFDRDTTIGGYAVRWWGDAADSNMEIELVPMDTDKWTYAATGFIPGGTPIVKRSDYQDIAKDVDPNAPGAWKVIEMSYFIDSSDVGGVVTRITTTAGNTFLNCHISILAFSEELV
jgi:hypothetical protein